MWVKCEDRLPIEKGWYTVKDKNGNESKMHYQSYLSTRFPAGFSYIHGSFSWRSDNVVEWFDGNIAEVEHDI